MELWVILIILGLVAFGGLVTIAYWDVLKKHVKKIVAVMVAGLTVGGAAIFIPEDIDPPASETTFYTYTDDLGQRIIIGNASTNFMKFYHDYAGDPTTVFAIDFPDSDDAYEQSSLRITASNESNVKYIWDIQNKTGVAYSIDTQLEFSIEVPTQPLAQLTYEFPVKLLGLHQTSTDNRTYIYVNGTDEHILTIYQPIVIDYEGVSEECTMSITDGNLTIGVSNNFIKTATFPIVIDPIMSFSDSLIDSSSMIVESVFIADVDGDGDNDVIAGCFDNNDLRYYNNTDGKGGSWSESVIDGTASYIEDMDVFDINEDGYPDIVVCRPTADDVYYYENDGDSTFTRNTLNASLDDTDMVRVVDIDGDNDYDIVTSSDVTNADFVLFLNDGSESWTQKNYALTGIASGEGCDDVDFYDIDGDDDLDVFLCEITGEDVLWLENNGSATNPGFTQHNIDTSADNPSTCKIVDIDGDGYMDVLCGTTEPSGYVDCYYENDGTPLDGGWTQTDWLGGRYFTTTYWVFDYNDDGNDDILGCGSIMEDVSLFLGDGNGNWEQQVTVYRYEDAYSCNYGDIDGDGDYDFVVGGGQISWSENTNDANYSTFSNPSPANLSSNQSTSFTYNITVTNKLGNSSTVDFYTSTDGSSWTHQQTNNTILNESVEVDLSSLTEDTRYYIKTTANTTLGLNSTNIGYFSTTSHRLTYFNDTFDSNYHITDSHDMSWEENYYNTSVMGDGYCNFWYHMYGAACGDLELLVQESDSSWTILWSEEGNQGNQWNNANVSLENYTGASTKLRFRHWNATGFTGDVAIDNVTIGHVGTILDTESFETSLGDWSQVSSTREADWTRDQSGTPSSNTGPSSGQADYYYMFTETSGEYGVGIFELEITVDLSGSTTGVEDGYLISDIIYYGTGEEWGNFYAQVNNTAGTVFSLIDPLTDYTILGSLDGDGDDVSSVTNSSLRIRCNFTQAAVLQSWNITYTDTITYETEIRKDGVDYLVWLAEDENLAIIASASHDAFDEFDFDESGEYIAVWNTSYDWDEYWYVDSCWVQYHPHNYSGPSPLVKTFDILKVYLKDTGTGTVYMVEDDTIDYDANSNTTIPNNSTTGKGLHFCGWRGTSSTSTALINSTVGLGWTSGYSEIVSLWDYTLHLWYPYFAGFPHSTSKTVEQWDVLRFSIGSTTRYLDTSDF